MNQHLTPATTHDDLKRKEKAKKYVKKGKGFCKIKIMKLQFLHNFKSLKWHEKEITSGVFKTSKYLILWEAGSCQN